MFVPWWPCPSIFSLVSTWLMSPILSSSKQLWVLIILETDFSRRIMYPLAPVQSPVSSSRVVGPDVDRKEEIVPPTTLTQRKGPLFFPWTSSAGEGRRYPYPYPVLVPLWTSHRSHVSRPSTLSPFIGSYPTLTEFGWTPFDPPVPERVLY